MLGSELAVACENNENFKIYQLLFADVSSLVSESQKKQCWLRSEFRRVMQINKFRVNMVKSTVFS